MAEATGKTAAVRSDGPLDDALTLGGKDVSVKLNADGLEWTPVGKGKAGKIPYEDIFRAHLGARVKGKTYTQDSSTLSFMLYYKGKTKKTWIYGFVSTVSSLVFSCPQSTNDERTCGKWVEKINQYLLQLFPDRPRRLMILINPASGKFKGQELFEKLIGPTFQMAGVETDVTVLERGGHGRSLLQECDLRHVDGVVVCGGDGTFSDCFTGLLLRSARENNVNVNDANVKLVKTPTRVGHVATGTGNLLPYLLHRTKDPLTATLSIIAGGHFAADVVSVHGGNTFLTSGALSGNLGAISDVCIKRNNLRAKKAGVWEAMKMLSKLFNARVFRAELNVLKENGQEQNADDWELLSVDGATDVIAWMGEFSSTHWFPGYLGVAIHKPVSTLGEMKYMKGFATMDSRARTMPHITNRRTQVCKIRNLDLEEHLQRSAAGEKPSPAGDAASAGGAAPEQGATAGPVVATSFPEVAGGTATADGETFVLDDPTVTFRLQPGVLWVFGKKEFPDFPLGS